MSTQVTATIRMYRLHELGDCFLLTFRAGESVSNLLVDCGSFRNGADSIARIKEIVTGGIKADLDGRPLDVVVGTHQHNDHLSGFVHCEKEFRQIGVEQVWLSWLDNPKDKKAQRIGRDYNNLTRHLVEARNALSARVPKSAVGTDKPEPAGRALGVLNDILGFYGASTSGSPAELPAKATGILKTLGKKDPLYLKPGRTLEMPGLPEGSVRIHVLGPPRTSHDTEEDDPLFRKDPRKGESYDHEIAAAGMQAFRFMTAAGGGAIAGQDRPEQDYPFKKSYKISKSSAKPALKRIMELYNKRGEGWRKIDDDWMQQAESLALWIDGYTNNSSLVLAIELVKSGKVLLFAADAQTGNWSSWKDIKWDDSSVKTDSLVERTVFYKVGHHASHNATLPEVFDKAQDPGLVALIPVHKQDPNIKKKNGWKMPAKKLFEKLVESTNHRVLQMDNVNPKNCDPSREPAKSAWRKAGITPKVGAMAIEITISG